MKKKKYITPNVEIVPTEIQQSLLAGSKVKSSMDSDETRLGRASPSTATWNSSGRRKQLTGKRLRNKSIKRQK